MNSSRTPRQPATMVIAVIALVAALGGTAAATGWHHVRFPVESFHRVGAAGQPAYGNGGQGDCVWSELRPASALVTGLNPAGFYKDPFGEVHLVGVIEQSNGPGGDGGCGGPDLLEDSVAFILPRGYRPENAELSGDAGAQLIVPDEGATLQGVAVPAGAVIPLTGTTILDGVTFRAAGSGTRPIETDAQPRLRSLRALRRALD